MTHPANPEDPQRDPTKPRSAQPPGQPTAVMPPSSDGATNWKRPAMVAGAVVVILLVLLLLF